MTVHDLTQRQLEQQAEFVRETITPFQGNDHKKPKSGASDNRGFPRKPLAVPIDFVLNGKAQKAFARDLSYSGIYIDYKDSHHCRVKDPLAMTFLSSNNFPFVLKGTIARKDASGIGVHFVH